MRNDDLCLPQWHTSSYWNEIQFLLVRTHKIHRAKKSGARRVFDTFASQWLSRNVLCASPIIDFLSRAAEPRGKNVPGSVLAAHFVSLKPAFVFLIEGRIRKLCPKVLHQSQRLHLVAQNLAPVRSVKTCTSIYYTCPLVICDWHASHVHSELRRCRLRQYNKNYGNAGCDSHLLFCNKWKQNITPIIFMRNEFQQ